MNLFEKRNILKRGIETGIELKNMTPMMKALIFGMSGISYPFLIFMPSVSSVFFCLFLQRID